ncbi:MAG: HDOD domain-containing protein [Methylophilaceae bacterium]|jgi:HD-like signal output (HDOD) protein|nr:HDOD domain-containing protein [Methylophilaceae bacterium]
MNDDINDAIAWLKNLRKINIPVLKQTARELAKLKDDEDNLSARAISTVVLNDPFMVFKVLSYTNSHPGKHQVQDILEVEQAIIMLGTSNFFGHLSPDLLVDDRLKSNMSALTHLLKLIKRAHRAAYYAADWAALRKDLHSEKIWIAALLHDFAEMLMWCFAPEKMNIIFDMQKNDKSLRTKDVQQQILGFHTSDLQKELIKVYAMPPLLTQLMNDDGETEQDNRVKNVSLAVNLARHSANGWDDAALPDDYAAIADFLHVDVARVLYIIKHPDAQSLN